MQRLSQQMDAMLTHDEGDAGALSGVVAYASSCFLGLDVTSEVQDAGVMQGN